MKVVYIDVQNVHTATKKLWWLIDWQRFFVYIKEKYKPDIIYYAVWYVPKYQDFYANLESIGYTLLLKKTLILPDGTIKGNVDIDIAIQAMLDLCRNWLQQAYLITNDGDYYNTLVKRLLDEWVFSGLIVPDSLTASKLIKEYNYTILDLQDIQMKIKKTPTN